MDLALLELWVCPKCRGRLALDDDALVCPVDGLRFPVVDGVPYLVVELAERSQPVPDASGEST
jgi:uncharacterized protein YbaR (Trm112 family)